jgi:hypothetical protein
MRPVHILLLVLALCGTGIGSVAARADDRGDGGGGSWCQQNPDKCASLKSRRDDFCKKNPQSCEPSDSRRDSRNRGNCNDNPQKCDSRRRSDD